MRLKFIVVVATATLLPLCAHAQTPAEIQRVSKIIGADPAKKQAYCEMGKLEPQMAAADQKKDTKKLEELGKKADELGKKVGPEYAKMMEALEKIDQNSAEGKKLAPAMQEMTKMCPR
jgi:mevalonate kinase